MGFLLGGHEEGTMTFLFEAILMLFEAFLGTKTNILTRFSVFSRTRIQEPELFFMYSFLNIMQMLIFAPKSWK